MFVVRGEKTQLREFFQNLCLSMGSGNFSYTLHCTGV